MASAAVVAACAGSRAGCGAVGGRGGGFFGACCPGPRWPGAASAMCSVRALGAVGCWAAFPSLLDGTAGLAPPWWWAWVACAGRAQHWVRLWCYGGTPGCAGPPLRQGRCRGGMERAAVTWSRACCRHGVQPGLLFGYWGCHRGVPYPAARDPQGENPVQLWTSDDGVIGVVPFLEASFLRPVSACGSVGGVLFGGVAHAQRRWRCAGSVLAARCRGPMGAGGLGLARMVQR